MSGRRVKQQSGGAPLPSDRIEPKTLAEVPSVWDRQGEIRERLERKTPVLFLDYDGTLTPIVEDHTRAELGEDMRAAVAKLARQVAVGIVSGRDLEDLRNRVGLDSVFLAGSHGFDIAGPKGWRETLQQGREFLPDLDQAESSLHEHLDAIDGAAIERKRFSIAVHYRRVRPKDETRVEQSVDRVLERLPQLHKGYGKKVFRIQPDIDWDKGHAVRWLLERLELDRPDVLPVYLGDDVTDEDAFRALQGRGLGIVIRDGETRSTAAHYALEGPDDVKRFLEWLIELGREKPA